MSISYAAEKFSTARKCLMLPHIDGEAHSIRDAFLACDLGLKDLDRRILDDSARAWVRKLDEFMNTGGIADTEGKGSWLSKAETLSIDDMIELSRIVDELADWFYEKELTDN